MLVIGCENKDTPLGTNTHLLLLSCASKGVELLHAITCISLNNYMTLRLSTISENRHSTVIKAKFLNSATYVMHVIKQIVGFLDRTNIFSRCYQTHSSLTLTLSSSLQKRKGWMQIFLNRIFMCPSFLVKSAFFNPPLTLSLGLPCMCKKSEHIPFKVVVSCMFRGEPCPCFPYTFSWLHRQLPG